MNLHRNSHLHQLAGAAGLHRLVGPAGLDLGGASLDETALSVLAEIAAVENGPAAPARAGAGS
ncbi:hypothetical protein [Paractinoplanes toevensis]|uniref:Uncharacterized protein n=1 Tax=Paractinoplanes toevensis TaxID=571911 RepID=A0A919W165_9ACTN|nr:hypothetical protein [Actinoplanes toevensis]GIM90049.1 hypothetical protein Ato02nite_018420 [Actinoplanes toevensis]